MSSLTSIFARSKSTGKIELSSPATKELQERFLDLDEENPKELQLQHHQQGGSSNEDGADYELDDVTIECSSCENSQRDDPYTTGEHTISGCASGSDLPSRITIGWGNLVSMVGKHLISPSLDSPPPASRFHYSNYYNNLATEDFIELEDEMDIHGSADNEEDDPVSFRVENHSRTYIKIRSFIRRIYRRVHQFLTSTAVASALYLSVLGLSAAVFCTILELSITRSIQARLKISSMTDNFLANYGLWVGYGLVSTYMAVCCTEYISPFIIGSGIPEIKTLMSGVRFPKLLGVQVMLGKGLSMVATMAAGFSVGRIGPFVHMTSCWGFVLMKKIPIFRKIYRNEQLRINMLSAACSVGVSAILGAPFGGVLFSLELMTNYYLVSNLWKGVVAATFGSFCFYAIRQSKFVGYNSGGTSISLFPTDFAPFAFHPWEYLAFIGLGTVCGLVGTFYNWVSVFVFSKFRRIKLLREARFSIVLLACFIFSLIDFHIPILKLPIGNTLSHLFGSDIRRKGIIGRLISAVFLKMIMTIVASLLPLPNSVIAPSFTIGACLGRIYAEVLSLFLNISIPGGYAVVGAACYSASITRTLSLIVIMSEITGQLSYIIPIMISTVISVSVSSLFTESLFIALIKEKKLPFLPVKDPEFGADTSISKFIETDLHYITPFSTIEEIAVLLKEKPHSSYPIIESKLNPCIIGEVTRVNLQNALHQGSKKRRERAVSDLTEMGCSMGDTMTETTDFDSMENARDILLNRTDPSESMLVTHEPAPLCIHKYTTFNKANFVFSLLGISHAFVLHKGRLVGVLTKTALINANEVLETRKKQAL